jgi:hypothetical protein
LKGKKNEIYFIKFHPWNLDDIIAKKSNGGWTTLYGWNTNIDDFSWMKCISS